VIPPLAPLRTVMSALRSHGIEAAIGGSGLLLGLGLTDTVNDWDLTCDAPWEQVEQALRGLPALGAPCGDSHYRSSYRLAIPIDGVTIDLMGRFSIETEAGVCHLPTIACGCLEPDLPTGSPDVWAVAYRLMGRHAKADKLFAYVQEHGGRPDVVEYLLRQPLPAGVRAELAAAR